MELQSYDVVVIQHYDRLDSGEFAHSTTVGVGATIDSTVIAYIILLDKEVPLCETIDAGTIPHGKDYKKLRELFKKEVMKEFPNKSPEEKERIAEELASIVHGTKRRVVLSFEGQAEEYKQIVTRGNYWN